ncbi:unnamed protein product [Urochloa decumbens]|uniref:KIB1-4 beta-propeller domain-containing protein n=1 Tax=Urochloa decumbens TaxID=240449 RepID=A0ABC9BFS3_9POAL
MNPRRPHRRPLLLLVPSNLASQGPLLLLVPDKDRATESPTLFHLPRRRCLPFRLPPAPQDSTRHLVSLGCRVVIRDYLSDLNRRDLRMVHLLTGEQTRLPPPNAKAGSFNHFILSGDLLVNWGYFGRTICFCRLGAADWSVATIRIRGVWEEHYFLEDIICVKGTIYALVSTCYWYDRPGYRLGVVNISENWPSSAELVLLGDRLDARSVHLPVGTPLILRLAECLGQLIVVSTSKPNPRVDNVFCWKSEESKWVRITRIGGCALFFGTPFFVGSLGPDHPGIRKDCIYFSRDGLWSEYSLIDGSFRQYDHAVLPGGRSRGDFSAPVWVLPSKHS